MKRILITAGGTREYIDDVRVLTNISTGKLGAMIAEYFLNNSDDVEINYIAPKSAVHPEINSKTVMIGGQEFFHLKENLFCYDVTDVQSVYNIMKELVPTMDVVIHAMAVSDFGFKPCSTKLKSNDPMAFIESLKERIYQTPKILKEIKTWNPNCKLISFKFEVGLPHQELINIATKSGLDNGSDLVIANDKFEMMKVKVHKAYALDPKTGKDLELNGKEDIVKYIFNWVK